MLKKLLRRIRTGYNNKGLSLVELLLAIVILGLVAAPILQFIISSMSLNLKSRDMLAGADVGQHFMENIVAKTYNDCVQDQFFNDDSSVVFFIDDVGSFPGSCRKLDSTSTTLEGFESHCSSISTDDSRMEISANGLDSNDTKACMLYNVDYCGKKFDVEVIATPNTEISGESNLHDITVKVYYNNTDGGSHNFDTAKVTINGTIFDAY